jgi:HK97 family phage prohead protease
MKRTSRKELLTTASAVPGETADAAMVVTTAQPDRVGDRIVTAGLDITNFLKNPVLLWGHDHSIPPIASVTALELQPDRLRAAWRWNASDEFARRVRAGWDGGFIRAASIGFRPLADQANELGGVNFTRAELLEISLCAVPCNQHAVRELTNLRLWPGIPSGHHREPQVLVLDDEFDIGPAELERLVVEAVRAQLMRHTGRVD